MGRLKKLPIGRSDFKSIILDNMYYVDKTLLIKEVVNSGDVILITRPRRFGKTLNISMLRYFFRNDQDNENLFKKLKIYEEKEIIDKHLNKYPVIFLTFKDLRQKNIDDMKKATKYLIAQLYTEYLDIIDQLNDIDKSRFLSVAKEEADYVKYENALKDLTKYLSQYYGKKVILLIDEYDTPIQQSYLNGYYNDFINFMGNIFGNVLKDNEYLQKAVLTGITRVAKESIFTGVNNLKVSTILNESFNDKFGLLKQEVRDALKYYGLEYEEDKIIQWYNGFNFGGMEIYNPFSIINLIDEKCEIKPYWINTSGNELIKKLIREGSVDLKEDIEKIVKGGSIISRIDENLVYADLDKNVEESIWTLFLFTGYLKWTKKISDIESSEVKYSLKATNKETIGFFEHIIAQMLREKIKIEDILLKLVYGNYEEFTEDFKSITKNTLSYFDTTSNEPERFYHALILGMTVTLKNEYFIKSNREAGEGRADLILIPKDLKRPGIIFEFKKFYKKDKTLKNSAKIGLKQINDKKYEQEIRSYNIDKVIKVAMAFNKNEVEILIEEAE